MSCPQPSIIDYGNAIPFYVSKVDMARARSTITDDASPADVKRVLSRQQSAEQLVLTAGAVVIIDPTTGTCTVNSGEQSYSVAVSASARTMSCTCPDNAKGVICKHLRAVIIKLGIADS